MGRRQGPQPGRGGRRPEDGRLVVGRSPAPPGAPVVLVYGHYDVQPPDPLELWESDPFAAEARGEWLYAREVADDKGQLWMQLEAIASLVRENLPVTFRVVCDGEEETGGDAITRFLDSDDGPADACVILDGWMKRRNRPELVVATRGLSRSTSGSHRRARPPLGALQRDRPERDPRADRSSRRALPRDGRLPSRSERA